MMSFTYLSVAVTDLFDAHLFYALFIQFINTY